MRKLIILSLLFPLCLNSLAQGREKVTESINEYSQRAGQSIKDIMQDLIRCVKSNKDITICLKSFIEEYKPGSAKFDNAIRSIAHSNILPSILAAGASENVNKDILSPMLDIFESANINLSQNETINKLYGSTKEFFAKAIRSNPTLFSQVKSYVDGSEAYQRATEELLKGLLPKNLSENERACADILLHYYSYLAAGGSSASLSEKDMETIKKAFVILSRHGGGSPFGLSLEYIMAQLEEVFPWFTNVSWLVPSSK